MLTRWRSSPVARHANAWRKDVKFLLLMRGMAAEPEASDDQTAAYNRRWVDLMGALARRGALESGLPLQPVAKLVGKDGASDFPVDAVDIGGYMVINAASLDEAIEIAGQAPHIELGGTTIVRPCLEVPA
jgi:hypothetical protein